MIPICFAFQSSARASRRRAWVFSSLHSSSFSNLDDLMGDVDQILSDFPSSSSSSSSKSNATTSSSSSTSSVPYPWVTVDWRIHQKQLVVTKNNTKPSPVEEKMVDGRRVFFKRDDLLRLQGSQISGNKARKMLSLNTISLEDFPRCIVSYGGPQSNSMLALAAVVNFKNRELQEQQEQEQSTTTTITDPSFPQETKNGNNNQKNKKSNNDPFRFVYYTKKLPRFLRTQPSGNLFRATALGMELVELSHDEYTDLFASDWGGSSMPPVGLDAPVPGSSMWVPQGGAFDLAMPGATVLAEEIYSFWKSNGNDRPLSICIPGGTCTTAVLVHHALSALNHNADNTPLDMEVVVIPCVGDAAYSRRQMMSLSSQMGAPAEDIPSILQPSPENAFSPNRSSSSSSGKTSPETLKYFSFGEPHQRILDTFRMMREKYGVGLDLVYGAPAWTILLRHWSVPLSGDMQFDPCNPLAGREVMYVHSGGLEGINSQLLRYKYKGLVTNEDIQLPGKSSKS